MAITRIAIKSSTIANAERKIFNEDGARLPSMEIIAIAKAMSVAIGIPHPPAVSVPAFKAKYMDAGAITPPIAARMGKEAFLMDESSPSTISRLISRPTNRKKMAIKPSFIQRRTG